MILKLKVTLINKDEDLSTVNPERILNPTGHPGISNWRDLKFNWDSDLYRYTGKISKRIFLRTLLRNPSYRYTFLMRLCTYFAKNPCNPLKKVMFRVTYEVFRCYSLRSSVEITHNTLIGGGLYIPHLIGIVIHEDTVIGKNCNISQNVTIGHLKRGERKGSPTIGDNVYIAPGAVILGKIKIGNNVIIGANSVVTKDIPENAVAAGVPAQIISLDGSVDYIDRTDY